MATLNTYQIATAREDLSDIVSNISPLDFPFLTSIGTKKASGKYHEWSKDELAQVVTNGAQVENAPAPEASGSTPERLGNYTETRTKVASVAGAAQAVAVAGISDMMAYQVAKKLKELKRDKEATFLSANASNAGSGSVARSLGGAQAWISTNVSHGVGGATPGFSGNTVGAVTPGTARDITEAMYNEMIQKVWKAGGDVTKTFAAGPLKEKIAAFDGNGTKQQQAETKTIIGAVDYYVGNFGKQQIIPHRFLSETVVLAIDPALWAVAVLRGVKTETLGKTSDGVSKHIVEEYTLECLNEEGNGKLADVQ